MIFGGERKQADRGVPKLSFGTERRCCQREGIE